MGVLNKFKSILPDRSQVDQDRIVLDFPDCLRDHYPDIFDVAKLSTQDVIGLLGGIDYSALAKNSPGLYEYDWEGYLSSSIVRMLEVGKAVSRVLKPGSRILDYGSYFGNYSLLLSRLGYKVDAIDEYHNYGACFEKNKALLKSEGVTLRDFNEHSYDLNNLENQYDAVINLGVIEHVPHTPKFLLQALKRVIKPNGYMFIETPNLAYIYNRKKLNRGESVFPAIQTQFNTEIPFMGHHREYTANEIQWMIEAIGCSHVETSMYIYSIYCLEYIGGDDLINYRIMQEEPEQREIILVTAQKPL